MRRLPLYPHVPALAVETTAPLAVDPNCRRCRLGGKSKATCLPADGEAGGLLVVSDYPGMEEEAAGRPLASKSGVWLRQQIGKLWAGPVAYDFGVRCRPTNITADGVVDECRPYLAQTLAEVKPSRVVAFGKVGVEAVLGRSLSPLDVMRGFAWLTTHTQNGSPVPVFYMPSPVMALRNRLIRQFWYEPQLKSALCDAPPVSVDQSLLADWVRVTTQEDTDEVLTLCTASEFTSIDLEWAGHPFNRDHRILSMSLTPRPGTTSFVFGAAELVENRNIQRRLKAWWANPSARKVGSNLKADVIAFRSVYGVMLEGQVGDTRFLRRLLESDASAKLETMAELIGMGGHKEEMDTAGNASVAFIRKQVKTRSLEGVAEDITRMHGPTGVLPQHINKVLKGDNPKAYRMAFVKPELMQRYNARDTMTTALLHEELLRRLAADDPNLTRVWESLVLPVAWALGYVESWGMPVDRDALANFGAYLQAELDVVARRFVPYGYDPANPEAFNPDSAADVAELLFKTLSITPTHFTDTGKPATHAAALEDYAKQHPVAQDLMRWRKLRKLKGTYADGDDGEGGLLTHVRDDGRIHPSINPDGTRTGRASSSGPNLQNIPRADTNEGKMLRDCFVAPPGWKFVELDHSQLELRIAADQSGDENMLAIFHSGEDYHLRTAKLIAPQVWPNIDPESITKDGTERTAAKSVNFGVLYDDSPYGLAFRMGMPVQQAVKVRDALFGKFKKLGRYIEERVQETSRSGTARTWWAGGPARRRWLVAVADVDEQARKTARRSSWNTPIQGTGSDYLAAGMVEVVRWILEENVPAQVCVPIHDAILALVRDDVLEEYLYVVPRLMTALPTRSGVPLVVDAKVGQSWGSMEKRKLAR